MKIKHTKNEWLQFAERFRDIDYLDVLIQLAQLQSRQTPMSCWCGIQFDPKNGKMIEIVQPSANFVCEEEYRKTHGPASLITLAGGPSSDAPDPENCGRCDIDEDGDFWASADMKQYTRHANLASYLESEFPTEFAKCGGDLAALAESVGLDRVTMDYEPAECDIDRIQALCLRLAEECEEMADELD